MAGQVGEGQWVGGGGGVVHVGCPEKRVGGCLEGCLELDLNASYLRPRRRLFVRSVCSAHFKLSPLDLGYNL